MAWWWMAAAGAALGAGMGWRLRRGGYRRGDERDRPTLPAHSVALSGIGLVIAWGLLTATAGRDVTVTAAGLGFAIVGLVVSWIDVDVHRIPNAVTATAAALFAGGFAVTAGVVGDWSRFGGAALAGLALLTTFALFSVISSFGAGDAKFAGVVGLVLGWVGWSSVIIGVFAALVAAALVAVVLLLHGRSRHSHLAFGLPLVIGTIVALAIV
ncbi:MAG TPA: prepilin peptidase [Microlunatus sp.]